MKSRRVADFTYSDSSLKAHQFEPRAIFTLADSFIPWYDNLQGLQVERIADGTPRRQKGTHQATNARCGP